MVEVFFAALAGGVFYSLRGGAISRLVGRNVGTQAARLCWAIPTGSLIVGASGLSVWHAPSAIALVFFGLLLPHGLAQNKHPVLISLLGMSTVNVVRAALIVLVAVPSVQVSAALLTAGLLGGPAYWLGWRSLSPWPSWREPRSTEMGEFYTGMAWWGLVMAAGV